ncbi:MAG: hypothetical protein OXC10_01390 [Rhodospirillaceae bacterium]|nr:hypothetical protein [Rhodospirillaceae bacterium]
MHDDRPVVRLGPSSCQPGKTGLEVEVRIKAMPEELLRAVVRDVEIERVNDS